MFKSFEVENERGFIIRGVINRPDKSGKFPCLIYCHGFTGHKLETHGMFAKIAKMLERKDIVSIRFDFTGNGESDGEFKDMTMSTEIQDFNDILKFSTNLSFVDANNINVIGFSMGGAIALIVSSSNTLIKNTILISPAVNMYDLIVSQIIGEKLDEINKYGTVNFDGYFLGKDTIDDIFNYNIFDYAEKINQNVLIIHGTCDESVSPVYSIKLKNLIGNNASLVYINGASHCYYKRDEQSKLFDVILNFCVNNIITGRPLN